MESGQFIDTLTSDFTDPGFQAAFRQYFTELGITVANWDGLFAEMNGEGDNEAYVRTAEDGSVVGFIQFKPIRFTSWFFEESCGFIREFWIAEAYRNLGHGSELLALAETYLQKKGFCTFVLTTDTAEAFYLRHGYRKAPGMKAKNGDPAYIKRV
ncbi:MAG: GNAT family N-acetyltransferase [Lachnospiraceae bacterium]|nr:GNAT family N-acetyltransferase [Lachnospiraceae bacterium]